MRVYDLAIRLGVPSIDVIHWLRGLGVPVKSASSWVEPVLAETLIASDLDVDAFVS